MTSETEDEHSQPAAAEAVAASTPPDSAPSPRTDSPFDPTSAPADPGPTATVLGRAPAEGNGIDQDVSGTAPRSTSPRSTSPRSTEPSSTSPSGTPLSDGPLRDGTPVDSAPSNYASGAEGVTPGSGPATPAGGGWPLPPAPATGAIALPASMTPSTAVVPVVPSSPYPMPGAPHVHGPGFGAAGQPGPATADSKAASTRRSPHWLVVAVVAAVIGGLVGGGVAVATRNNNSSGVVTVQEGSSAPGAATLSGGVSIPQLVDKVLPGTVSIDVKAGGSEDQGTGMIISSNGTVVTNNHVIELYRDTPVATNGTATHRTITVTESGTTKSYPATLVGFDSASDVALLHINGAASLPTVTFGNSKKAVVGDAVVAIGNALGLAAGTPTVTQGIISALNRTLTAGGDGTPLETLTGMIQTDAAINPGNSGGPLIDTEGQVIGMNTAVAGASSDGTSAQNIGFAIPISKIETLLPILQKGGPDALVPGFLGVSSVTMTSTIQQELQEETNGSVPSSGAVVDTVVTDSPADHANLSQGDVIVKVNSTSISNSQQLQDAIRAIKASGTATITYFSPTANANAGGNQSVTVNLISEAEGKTLAKEANQLQ